MTKRKASVALDTNNESNQSSSTQDNNSNSASATNTTTGTGNNQGATNGASPTGSGGARQQNSNSNSQQKNKKERADNWSSAEIQVLHRGIESRREIFHGPPSQATKKNRELAWDAITKEVNSVSTTPRSISQVMKKFKNEKCRAKRKFIDGDKDGHSNMNHARTDMTNTNPGVQANNNTSLTTQTMTTNSQQLQAQQQSHHMTGSDTMSSQPSSINVVKLAPQNVAKTMIDLPGHVQQIQMPNDDMVLIVPPEMDGLLSGMNIVSDGGNHFQKCTTNSSLGAQHQNHHGQHTMQTINPGASLVNGGMSNGMMARTIPAGSMSLVYSTGGEVCGADQHIANTIAGTNAISTGHISVNAQTLMHQRGPVDQSQAQHQHHHQLHQHPHQQHQQPHQQPQPQQQPQQPQPQQQQQQQPPPLTLHPHQPHQTAPHPQHHIQPNHIATTATIANTGGVAVESQLKNLLLNLLLKDGQNSVSIVNASQDHNKQRNEMLAIIANSLTKIEGHLSKISKVAGAFFSQNLTNLTTDAGGVPSQATLNTSDNGLNINSNDGNNNSLSMNSSGGTTLDNQTNSEA